MRQRRTALVLGSGLLRDVPIANLSRSFDTVVLVDLVHPASVRLGLRGRRLRNVRLISRDLSGLDQALSDQPVEPLSFLRQVPYLDLVISSNLLSQIGAGAERRLQDERGDLSPDLVARLIAAHVDGMASLPCSTILLTDTSYTVIDRSGVTHEEKDLLHGIRLPEPQQSWSWPVVPFDEESRDYEVVHQVAAISQLR